MNHQQRKQWVFERLKHSLQALGLPAPAQVAYYPDFVVKTDELVLDLDIGGDARSKTIALR